MDRLMFMSRVTVSGMAFDTHAGSLFPLCILTKINDICHITHIYFGVEKDLYLD